MPDLPLVFSVDRLKGMTDQDPVRNCSPHHPALIVSRSEMNAAPYAGAY